MDPRGKDCWVCGERDERTEPERKVLCWEDIELWIVRDPEGNGGRDRLAMQVLLRFHKGSDNKIQPTWYTFIEENLPVLCPITLIVLKALAEGVIEHPDYQRAENLFGSRIAKKMVHIPWKREFKHMPVFRKTLLAGEAFIKSGEPITDDTFDNNSRKLGRDVGMDLPSYVYRRGNLQVIESTLRVSLVENTLLTSHRKLRHNDPKRSGSAWEQQGLYYTLSERSPTLCFPRWVSRSWYTVSVHRHLQLYNAV